MEKKPEGLFARYARGKSHLVLRASVVKLYGFSKPSAILR